MNAWSRMWGHAWTVQWRRQILFIAGGLTVGLAAVAVAKLADIAQAGFRSAESHWPLLPWVLTPVGFAVSAWAGERFFPGAGGSGIPQVIVARATQDKAARARLVSLRIAAGKIVLLTWGLLTGASIGREGPTVQIGASIMFEAGRFAPHRQPGFVLAGAAAGVAAAFNTPLAGIVFGIEELSRSFEVRTSGLVIGTVIAAGLTSLALVGDYTYFGVTPAVLPFGTAWLAVAAMGIAGGVLGGVFIRLVVAGARGMPNPFGLRASRHRILVAFSLGLIVAACGYASAGATFGTGYDQAKAILHGEGAGLAWFAPLKFIATAASALSGVPGGIFSPSLAVGAGLGQALASVFPAAPVGALGLLGMVGFLTGVVQAPITAFVIVSEMTENHALIIPLMLTAIIADAVSKLLAPQGVYHALAGVIQART